MYIYVHIIQYTYVIIYMSYYIYICFEHQTPQHPAPKMSASKETSQAPARRRLILKICVEIPKKRKVKLTDWKWKWIVNGNGIGNGSFRISRLELDCTCLFGFLDWIVL